VKKMYKNALWKNLVMTTDPFDYNPREHDLWLAINALRFIVSQNYLPDHEWRLKEVAALLEMHLEQ
jgi:hypothetical protein